jgi:hypothetical protein
VWCFGAPKWNKKRPFFFKTILGKGW